jgi:hypothetical protein
MSFMIKIENKGQQVVSTNYWGSEHAKRGYFYLSWNAGAARLLVPDSMKAQIREMKSAEYVVVSRGKFEGRDALELMFEDGSDSPYVVHMVTEQTDRLIPESDQGGGFVVAVWTRSGMKLRLPGKYREVDVLPCLAAWQTH